MHSYKLYKRFNGINDNIFLKYNQPPPPLGLNSCSTSEKKKSAIRSIVKWPTTCSKMRFNAMTLVLSHIFKTFPYSFTWKHCNLFSIDWSSNVMPGFTTTLFFRCESKDKLSSVEAPTSLCPDFKLSSDFSMFFCITYRYLCMYWVW